MTSQERELITTLLSRLKSTAGQLKDPEADTLIRQAIAEQPDAPYYLVQTVLIQDLSLHQAQARITQLERQLSGADASKRPRPAFSVTCSDAASRRSLPGACPAPGRGPTDRT